MRYVCPNTTLIFGLSQDEVFSYQTIQRFMNGTICNVSDLKIRQEIKNIEWTVIDTNRQTRFLLINVISVNLNGGTVLYVMRDITDRKQDEEAKLLSKSRFEELFHKAAIPLCFVNKNASVLKFNRQFEKTFGYSKEDVPTLENWWPLAYPDPDYRKWVIDTCYAELARAAETNTDIKPIEYNVTCKNGDIRTMVVLGSFIGDDLLLTFFDITERKRAEVELREAEVQYRTVADFTYDWEDWQNPDGTFRYVSPACERITGYPAKRFLDEPGFLLQLIVPEDRETLARHRRDAAETPGLHEVQFRIQRSDGKIRWVEHACRPVTGQEGAFLGYRGSNRDITERKRMEEVSLRIQKLESVGLLAGGIAHDFNNILTVIFGNVGMAKRQAASEDEIYRMLSEAEMASVRAQALTQQLLTFAKGGAPVRETASIKDLLKESSSFALRGSKAVCEFSIAEDLWPAEVDVGQVSQAINNIMINSNQAMPHGGIIRVAAENLLMENTLGVPIKPGRYIKISIMDQGVGILEEHLLHIFDPYFTTKHEGSGLGLATTHSIIQKHDGHIAAESQVGVGTTFYIYLPASDKAVPDKEEIKLIKGHGRILVMDDEASLRKVVEIMLEQLGYESNFAKNGAEAVEMYKRAKEAERPYVAVILDLTVPGGMGGKEAIKNLLEIDPATIAIVSSGYSDDPVLTNFQEYGFKGMLSKPYEFRSLGKVLQEVLKDEYD
jgi:PAS domain S-box-containing protein